MKHRGIRGRHGCQVSKHTPNVVDLEKVFGELRKYDMRLNPEKCTFGVGSDKFLGFMITHWGIEANQMHFHTRDA